MENINDIISGLSQDDIEMLKGVAQSILGGDGEQNRAAQSGDAAQSTRQSTGKNAPPVQNLPAQLGISSADLNMMMKAKKIFDKMNSASDKNTDLIMALKPHLSPENRNKADTAIKILRLFDALPYLKELF
ncbi:MAG: hypothetical protein EGQ73_01350 [Clostridiales bacterium]|nr:hypothetical protein [Clostridiales bacterium]